MAAPDHHRTQEAIALQLLTALETYETDVLQLCRTWLDMEQYQRVSEEIDELRMYAAALPRLSGPWVEVLISHAELVHAMWKAARAGSGADAAATEVLLADHLRVIRQLDRAARRSRGPLIQRSAM